MMNDNISVKNKMEDYTLFNYINSNKIILQAIQDNNISIQKFRQIMMICGAYPNSFFIIKGNTAQRIKSKSQLFNKVENQDSFENLFYVFPPYIRNLFSNKKLGGNLNTGVHKISTLIICCFLIYYFNSKKNHSNRIVKIIRDNTVVDKIHSKKLNNRGNYDGCFSKIDSSLHQLFKKSFTDNDSIRELRYKLLKEWKSSYFGAHYLKTIHLIRSDGSLRDTPEEIAHAIKEYKTVTSSPVKYLNSIFSTRRKSSQQYLRTDKSSSQRRSSSQTKTKKKVIWRVPKISYETIV